MRWFGRFGRFWYDFIVGDDWRVAAGVVVAAALTFVLAHHGINVWWLLPVVALGILAVSITRATRPSRRR